MTVMVQRKDLQDALRLANTCVAKQSSRTRWTALSGIRLSRNEAIFGDQYLTLTATDLRQYIEVGVPASGDGDLDFVVTDPASFLSMVRTVDANLIGLEICTKNSLRVTAGRTKSNMRGEVPSDFPHFPPMLSTVVPDLVLKANEVHDLATGRFAAERGRAQVSVLQNAYITVNDGITTLVTANGVQVAQARCTCETSKRHVTAVIATDAWDLVDAFADRVDRVLVYFTEQRVDFLGVRDERVEIRYAIQAVNAPYPDTKIAPIKATDSFIEVDTKALRDLIKQAQLLSDGEVTLVMEPDWLWLKAHSEAGTMQGSIEGASGAPARATVSTPMLAHAVQQLSGEKSLLAICKGKLKIESDNLLYAVQAAA